MKRNPSIVGLALGALTLMLLSMSCELFGSGSFKFDLRSNTRPSARAISDTAIFCDLSKFEVELNFLYVRFNQDSLGTSEFTLVNKEAGSGFKVNLVNQKLSEVVPSGTLNMNNATSDVINKIWMGFGPTVTVCGYIRDNINAKVYRTSATGIIEDDGGDPVDYIMATSSIETSNGIPAYSVDTNNPPLATDLSGVYLWLVGKNATNNLYEIKIPKDGSFEFIFPTNMGVIKSNIGADSSFEWKALPMEFGFPFVDGGSNYYEFYLKKTGSTVYTDYMRILMSGTGNLVLGQAQAIAHIADNEAVMKFSSFKVWYNADEDPSGALYPNFFKNNPDGSIWISSNNTPNTLFPAFRLSDHSGTATIGDISVDYDAKLLE